MLCSIWIASAWHDLRGVAVAAAAGWAACTVLGAWIDRAIAHAADRIDEVGRAHEAERLASELEAQQRQDARVLHDTVLATLSLLAHSGVGVGPSALRQQAGDDARLLRQLRLGAPLDAGSTAIFSPESDDDDGLSTTFESVRQRFARMGLAVNWHGAGQLALPRETLDALLGALGECLENVRRHSGVNEADVTVTDDDRTVRAMVTDAGNGFEPDTVDGARLGYAESVVGRLQHRGRTRADLLVARLRDDRHAGGAEAMTDRSPPLRTTGTRVPSARALGAHRARAAGDVRESHGGRRLATGITIAAAFIVLAHLVHTIALLPYYGPASARGPRGSPSRRSWGSASSRDSCRACCRTGSTSCSWRAGRAGLARRHRHRRACWTTVSCRPPPRRRERC